MLSAFPQRGRFRESRRRTIAALIYVLERDVPWSTLPAEFGAAHGVYRNCLRWVHTGVLDALLIKLVQMGHTHNWGDASMRYGGQFYDHVGVRNPGTIHILMLKQAHLYRERLSRGVPLRPDQPLRRVFQQWLV